MASTATGAGDQYAFTTTYLGLRFDLTANLIPEDGGTRLELQADTHWPRGMGRLGRFVEAVVLSGHEAHREVQRFKLLVERDRH